MAQRKLVALVVLILAGYIFIEAQTGETPASQQSQPQARRFDERSFPNLINVGSISGVVIDQEGKPVSDAWATAQPEENMIRPIHVKTDSDGHFLFSSLPVGVIYLSAYKESDGYPYNFFGFYILPKEQFPKVNLTSAGISDVTIRLGEKAGRLDLDISTEDGSTPMTGDLVFTRLDIGRDHSESLNMGTQSKLVPSVPFRLSVNAPGYEPWHYDSIIMIGSGKTMKVSILLKKSRTPIPNPDKQ